MDHSAFVTIGTAQATLPVVLSVPHAGRVLPGAAAQLLNAPLAQLRPLEDRHADLLATSAIDAGASAIIAQTSRLWIDLNRSEQELDPAMVASGRHRGIPLSTRTRGGLGLIPRRLVGVGEIWRAPLSADDVTARIAVHHRPYHAELAAMLARTKARFGAALLIDLHSMPPLPMADAPDIVIGDRWGTTAAPQLTAAAESVCAAAGLRVAINAPYAGGHILMQHAGPDASVHAIQVEIGRHLYLDAALDAPGPSLKRMQRLVERLVATLAEELLPRMSVAAE